MKIDNIINKFLKVTPVIALIIASTSLWKSFQTDSQIAALQTKYLQDVTENLAGNFVVKRPANNDVLNLYKDYTYDVSYSQLWPPEYQIWLIGRHKGSYKLFSKKKLHHNKTKRELSNSGLNFTSEGEWELMLCLATENAIDYLNATSYIGFDRLPDGIAILETTKVKTKR